MYFPANIMAALNHRKRDYTRGNVCKKDTWVMSYTSTFSPTPAHFVPQTYRRQTQGATELYYKDIFDVMIKS